MTVMQTRDEVITVENSPNPIIKQIYGKSWFFITFINKLSPQKMQNSLLWH